jgi:hypothetical protein
MNKVYGVFLALMASPHCGHAQDLLDECLRQEIRTHVLQQFDIYGPQSAEHEYFGFIYRVNGEIATAITRSSKCHASGNCTLRTAAAAKRIPSGAKILGEWHTHPHHGSKSLSQLDVRGAYYNRHIKCYTAYFSAPSGEIYLWDANDASVPTAMASAELIGNYRQQLMARLR